jgi:hypothetical protein
MENSPPPAQGVRLEWATIPARVRAAVEDALGSAVVEAISQPSGFSPGVAARLRLADGRRVFAKAISSHPNPTSPAFHRREAAITAAIPAAAPVPRLLWSYDEGEEEGKEGWVVLVFADVDGYHPAQPWRLDELHRVLDAMAELAAQLTPSPLTPPVVPTAGERIDRELPGWRLLVGAPPELIAKLDPWSRRHLDALIELETAALTAVAGHTLLHLDIRADNLLLTPEQVWFLDWPHACVGAAWLDVLYFLPSVTMQGGPPPEQVMDRHPACRAADSAALNAGLAAVAGLFTERALHPPPPGLPTLRAFQAAQGAVARAWLAQRTGWP